MTVSIKPNLPIISNFQPLVKKDHQVRLGSENGPTLVERYDAGPGWDGLTNLTLNGPIDRKDMDRCIFLQSADPHDEARPLGYNTPLGNIGEDKIVLLGAEVVEKDGQYLLHTRSVIQPGWCNDKVLPGYDSIINHDEGWQVACDPTSARKQHRPYPLG